VVLELEALLESEPKLAQSAPLLEGTRAGVLFFTSGTTGTPKGVLLSHDQLAALARLVGSAWRVTASDRLVHCLPLHHTHGLGIAFLVCMLAGASQHFLQRFEAQAVWRAFDESTLFMGVPTMHKRLLDAYAAEPAEVQARWRAAAKRQRLITSGSSALPESLALGWAELCGSLPLERYGMTEVGVALSNPFEGERRAGSPGPVLPGMQVRLVDASGRDVAKDEPGEIWIRGPSVFSGYDADEAATSSSFCEGWFKSGDTAIWLDDGYVKILGRTSIDIIKSGGYKLSALEIEEATRRCAGVEDVAVVGVPDAEFGEIAVAVIVLKGQLEAETITRFLKAELAPYKVPRRIVFTSALPHNALGKVTKHLLRERIANQLC
jgi:malonyl-CoA/methylmalonyl-CoA synthetase